MRQKIIDAIMEHAAAEYPRECCGVVVQKAGCSGTFPAVIWQPIRQSISTCHRKIMPLPKTGEQ